MAVGFYIHFSFTLAADYSVNYTVSEPDGIIDDVIATTRELQMSTGIGVLTLTFSIAQDDTDEDPEDFFLFLEGTRRVFVLCPVGRVIIIDLPRKDLYGQLVRCMYRSLFLFLVPAAPAVEVGFASVQYTV